MIPERPLVLHSRLFDLAREGRLRLPASMSARGVRLVDRIFYPAAAFFYALMAPFLGTLLVLPFFVIMLFARNDVDPNALTGQDAALALFLGTAPLYLLVWAWLRFFERRGLVTTGLERAGLWLKYGRGLLVGLGLFGAAVALLALSGDVTRQAGGGAETLNGGTAAAFLLIFLGWVVQGGSEEVLARGFLLPVFGLRFGARAGVVISSLAFAAIHLFNPNLSPIGLLNLFLFGVFASLYALWEGGLWGVFAVHTAWNWTQGNLLGLAVSGAEVGQVVVLDLVEAGPDWWTGGAFGPEGGLGVTIVLLLASAVVLGKLLRPSGQDEDDGAAAA